MLEYPEMEKSNIVNRARALPQKEMLPLREAGDAEIWEGNENGTHFKLTREQLPINRIPPVFALSLLGNPAGMESLLGDFVKTFGDPLIISSPDETSGILFCMWDASKVDLQLEDADYSR